VASITPTAAYRDSMREILTASYFSDWAPGYLESSSGQADLEAHISGRMLEFDSIAIPWIREGFDLQGKSVLEIGCGTGSSSLPTAFAAGSVRAFDISPMAVLIARERARLLNAPNIEILDLASDWAISQHSASTFANSEAVVDVVLFIALLEHLTPGERVHALRAAWQVLKPGGILVVFETPNRLGCFDWHTFRLPFFHSLPDELAIAYASRSERTDLALSPLGDVAENLYRLGRGVSYHEFEIAIGLDAFTVVNDGYSRKLLAYRKALAHRAYDTALEGLLKQYLPRVPLGFSRPSLDLVLKKEPPNAGASKRRYDPRRKPRFFSRDR